MAQYYLSDLWYSLESCLTCFQSPTLKINRRSFKIVKLLGEGGFSYVYLVQATSGEYYAMKKIRCPFGPESVRNALREVEAYKIFDSPYIIKAIDSTVMQEKDGSKTVYIILPYYQKGNLQDIINDNIVSGKHIPEPELLKLVLQICQGLKAMHKHVMTSSSAPANDDRNALRNTMSTRSYATASTSANSISDASSQQQLLDDSLRELDEDDYDTLGNGYMKPSNQHDNGDEVDDLDLEINPAGDDDLNEHSSTAMGTMVPYAHRDIKPANIMLDNSDRPVLMDLGSTSRARVTLTTRQQALQLQDLAAEHCTLPYRAPELFYIKADDLIDERVDVWSLGCTIFAIMYLSSPFEMQAAESGASLNLAISSGQFKFPSSPMYSEGLKDLVKKCLTVNPEERPFIDEVITITEDLLDHQ